MLIFVCANLTYSTSSGLVKKYKEWPFKEIKQLTFNI